MTTGIVANDVTVSYRNGHTALRHASFEIPTGTITALVGVNGAGKSTLFKAIMGFVPAAGGSITVLGMPVKEALRQNIVAYVPQSEEVDWTFPVLVEDVVMMGRYGHMNFLRIPSRADKAAVTDALERVGVVRTLAEPNIMAVSGESANFLAGGEFPVPVASDEDGITVEFKPYGVGLAFTPMVLSEGRISLKISTEISELSNQGAFQGASGIAVGSNGQLTSVPGLTIPALVVRRAESVVELPSGGSTMLAGLIQSRSRQTIDQLPGIKKLPILGALFQSRDFENQETEMVVIITPYLVDPAKKDELKTPADGFVNASDPKTIFFGKLNAQYADAGEGLSKDNYTAPVGFIEE